MRRRAAKIDPNQPDIVRALRAAGATVRSLAGVGDGCPDLLVGFRGANYVLEVKDPESQRGLMLTPKQEIFFNTWGGQKALVASVLQALAAIGAVS